MTTATTSLASWLTAQLDADEAAAREWQAAMDDDETSPHSQGVPAWVVMASGVVVPARVLAQVAAMRRIVEWHATGHECTHYLLTDEPCPTLRALASVWADHPDYSDEWNRWDER